MNRPSVLRRRTTTSTALRPAAVEKVRIDVNGVRQGMVVVGADQDLPVLLFVHGGPGMPEHFLTHAHPTRLEELFTVVWWDQRGAGLSYSPDVPPASLTVEQLIADTLAVTDHLRERFGQDRIHLLGHSWGSFLGIQAVQQAPERYAAYIGMAQVVHQQRAEHLAHQHMLEAYRRLGDRRMVRALERAPVGLTGGLPPAYLAVRDRAMHRLGVGTMHDMRSVVTGIVLASLRCPGYTWAEKAALWRGRRFSRRSDLFDRALASDLADLVPALDVPVHLLFGAHDWTANAALAREYLAALHAPIKGFYTFPRSAHSPIFEEPDRAHRILRDDVLRGRTDLADP
jgi:pimeloyl-ACP methyl ester carboxylesterase